MSYKPYVLVVLLVILAGLTIGLALADSPIATPTPVEAPDPDPQPEPVPEPEPTPTESTLYKLLASLAAGVATVPAVSFVLNAIERRRGKPLAKDEKRFWAVALASLFGLLGFFGLIYLGYNPAPDGLENWVNALWPIFSAAFAASQIILAGAKRLIPGMFRSLPA